MKKNDFPPYYCIWIFQLPDNNVYNLMWSYLL